MSILASLVFLGGSFSEILIRLLQNKVSLDSLVTIISLFCAESLDAFISNISTSEVDDFHLTDFVVTGVGVDDLLLSVTICVGGGESGSKSCWILAFLLCLYISDV